jgi:hypothetical protein
MEELVQRYLGHRRQFGYRLFSQGYALLAFARFDETPVKYLDPGMPPYLRSITRGPGLEK